MAVRSWFLICVTVGTMSKRWFWFGWIAATPLLALSCTAAARDGDSNETLEMADIGEQTEDARESISSAEIPCGGFAALPCPSGYSCKDDPRDTCDPARGGADCIGICVPTGRP